MTLHRLALVGVAAILVLASRPGQCKTHAAKAPHGCAAAYKTVPKLEKEGQLRAASEALLICARASCNAFLRHECTVRHAQLEAEMPSVVPLASDESGAPLLDVQVMMDGTLLTARLDGRAIAVDPGLHEFSWKAPGGSLATRKIVILQGQRNRPLPFTPLAANLVPLPRSERPDVLPPLPKEPVVALEKKDAAFVAPAPADLSASAPARPAAGSLLAPALLGAAGVAGVVGYGLLTYWGRRDNSQLAGCSPDCAQTSVDHVRKLYLAADVSLGAGLVALAATSWLVWRGAALPGRERLSGPDAAATTSRRSTQPHVDVQPLAAGAVASIAGAF